MWLLLSAAAHAQQADGQLQPLPLTQLDERVLAADLDNRAFSLTFAQPVAVRDLLLLLVRGTSLSVVPDPSVSGTFIGELKNVTVRQALQLILPPLGLDYAIEGPVVRVFRREPQTRVFDLNYVVTTRTGTVTTGGLSASGSTAAVASTTAGDVFAEIENGVRTLLSEQATFNVDRKAGLLQVTDFPERLERVAFYVDSVRDRAHRQVQIDARFLEVELSDAAAQGLDWSLLAVAVGGGRQPPRAAALRTADVDAFLTALAKQGTVTVIASPSVQVLNNEPALVRATTQSAAEPGERRREDQIALEVTPQIAADGSVMLVFSPTFAVHDADERDQPAATTAVREADTLARLSSGETLLFAGFARHREVRERQNAGIRGGFLGRSTVVTRRRIELVILVTPRVLPPVGID